MRFSVFRSQRAFSIPWVVQERPAGIIPIDYLPRRPPLFQVLYHIGFAAFAVGGRRPADVPAILAGDKEKPYARGGIAVVGGVKVFPFSLVAHFMKRFEPGLEIPAALFGVGPPVREKRSPVNKLRHVFNQDCADIQGGQPFMDSPGIHAPLVMGRPAAAGATVKTALRRSHEQIKPPFWHQFHGVGHGYVLDIMPRGRMVAAVRLNSDRPVVYAHQYHRSPHAFYGSLRPGGAAAGAAE